MPRKSGRWRGGETRRAQFVKVARRLTRLRPVQAAGATLLWLTDTFDWLDLWHGNGLAEIPPPEPPNNHLSPRL